MYVHMCRRRRVCDNRRHSNVARCNRQPTPTARPIGGEVTPTTPRVVSCYNTYKNSSRNLGRSSTTPALISPTPPRCVPARPVPFPSPSVINVSGSTRSFTKGQNQPATNRHHQVLKNVPLCSTPPHRIHTLLPIIAGHQQQEAERARWEGPGQGEGRRAWRCASSKQQERRPRWSRY